jgi:eukaryotic-like serine/threonine-protein kinase
VSPIVPEAWRRISALLDEALALPVEDRPAFLRRACAHDPRLLAEAEQALAACDESGDYLESAGGGAAAAVLRDMAEQTGAVPDAGAGNEVIGPYRLIQKIGEGGMGEVWLAEQTEPIHRTVALKLIKAGMDTRQVVARFEAERQALALMDHPAIARVFDAGQTPRGLPYFVMEHVQGEPITTYCDRHTLTTRERIDLFVRVCDAIEHAHQKGIIHRDLKPSNVLVTVQDGRPVPKVIDFGVAKATSHHLIRKTVFTEQGVLIGTPEYMSPEQAELTGLDLDTRTDVYALGMMLYELLVGALPFDVRELRRAGFDEIRRIIREVDPPRPSARLSTLGEASDLAARNRRSEPARLASQLRGDLDWIAMKALEKDRTRRYASPNELAADIGRYLQHEPVLAGPPGTAYRARKFIRRHRLGVAAAALVTLALVTAVVGTSVGLVRARAEQERAEKTAKFLADTLGGIDPAGLGQALAATLRDRVDRRGRAALGSPPASGPAEPDPVFEGVNLIDEARTLVDDAILGKAVERIETTLKEEPALAADLYGAIAEAYDKLQLFQPALECSERAVRLSERARGHDDAITNELRTWLGSTYEGRGRYRDAEKVLLEAVDSLGRTRGENAPETLHASSALGWTYQQEGQAGPSSADADPGVQPRRRTEEAERILRKTLGPMRQVLGNDHRWTLRTAHGLGLALKDLGRHPEAEALLRDTVERMIRVQGGGDAETINTRLSLASVIYYSGRPEEGERMALELLNDSRRAVGEDSFLVLLIEEKLGMVYLEQGRYDEADGLLRKSARKMPLVLGEQSQFTREAIAAVARLDSLRPPRQEPEVKKRER